MGVKTISSTVHTDQQGFASIVIAIVLILVLSLTTIGFAELMRHEERSALDKQLSSQAYYAAETGVNDAAKALNAGFNLKKSQCNGYSAADIASMTGGTPAQITTNRNAASTYLSSSNVGSSNNAYTCLLIDPAVQSVNWDSVKPVESKVTELTGADFNNPDTTKPFGSLVISWQDASGGQSFVSCGANCTTFDTQGNWNYTDVVRITLTPLSSGNISRDYLAKNTYTAFLYPNASNASMDSDSSGQVDTSSGTIVKGNCHTSNTPLHCSVRITDLSEANYLLTVRTIYKTSGTKVGLTAYDSDGNQLKIKNAQTLVDSTGKAQDVLRRVQVRVATHTGYDHSDYGLESMSGICKQLQLYPNSSSNACSP